MNRNTAKVTATTFTLGQAHPNFKNMDAADLAEFCQPYTWPSEERARRVVTQMVEQNGFEHTEHHAPGLEVHAFYVNDVLLTMIVFEDVTAARLHRAVRRAQPVTVTYVKADGEETVRTIEPTGLSLTKAGDVIVKAVDRKPGEKRSFRLDRIRFYTVHRTGFTVRLETPAPSKADLVQAWVQAQPSGALRAAAEAIVGQATPEPSEGRRAPAGAVEAVNRIASRILA